MPDGRATPYRAAMRFAYADPPYVGQAKTHYGDHPDYAGEVDHAELIQRLEAQFDGWALSLSVPSLPAILPLCPTPSANFRICAWQRGMIPKKPMRLMWCWEPVLIRTPEWRIRDGEPYIKDSFKVMDPRGFLGGTITGQKPVEFCRWLFDALGMTPDDELVDLFPGSGSVMKTWDAWRRQGRLAV